MALVSKWRNEAGGGAADLACAERGPSQEWAAREPPEGTLAAAISARCQAIFSAWVRRRRVASLMRVRSWAAIVSRSVKARESGTRRRLVKLLCSMERGVLI